MVVATSDSCKKQFHNQPRRLPRTFSCAVKSEKMSSMSSLEYMSSYRLRSGARAREAGWVGPTTTQRRCRNTCYVPCLLHILHHVLHLRHIQVALHVKEAQELADLRGGEGRGS